MNEVVLLQCFIKFSISLPIIIQSWLHASGLYHLPVTRVTALTKQHIITTKFLSYGFIFVPLLGWFHNKGSFVLYQSSITKLPCIKHQ
jgi:hypothetical protein